MNDRTCGALGVDADGHCLRCGLPAPDPREDTETECPPAFFDDAGYPVPDEFEDDDDDQCDYSEEDVIS